MTNNILCTWTLTIEAVYDSVAGRLSISVGEPVLSSQYLNLLSSSLDPVKQNLDVGLIIGTTDLLGPTCEELQTAWQKWNI